MYYLLEDNRIVEWNGDCIIKDIPKKINGVYKMKKCIIFKSSTIKDGYIKKQSENVYDLIEVGDLVRYFDNIYEIKKLEIERELVYMDTQNGICFPSVTRFMELLNAIYKQDAKGNYIKVWEKKEDE